MIYDLDYFDCLTCHGNGCDRCGGTGKSNVPVKPNNNICSNSLPLPDLSGCGEFPAQLLYITPQKEELPAERFKIIDSDKRVIENFKCYSSPNGLIIELPKQELFPPYTISFLNPNCVHEFESKGEPNGLSFAVCKKCGFFAS